MYVCVKGIDFVYFYDYSIRFWKCSDSVVFFIFHFLTFSLICIVLAH